MEENVFSRNNMILNSANVTPIKIIKPKALADNLKKLIIFLHATHLMRNYFIWKKSGNIKLQTIVLRNL